MDWLYFDEPESDGQTFPATGAALQLIDNNQIREYILSPDNHKSSYYWRSVTDTIVHSFEIELSKCNSIPILEVSYHSWINRPVVYRIIYDGLLCYIGSSKNATRLQQHEKKLRGASRIDLTKSFFQYVPCDPYDLALMVEHKLIDRYNPCWQNTGFGRRPGDDRREDGPNEWGYEWGYDGYSVKHTHT